MKLNEITLLLGVDAAHWQELLRVWPNWVCHKPELLSMPCIIFYDKNELAASEIASFSHPDFRVVPWELPSARDQREEMLTGFVHIAAQVVTTPWYLKIDTDVVARDGGAWLNNEWFEPDANGRVAVMVASPWSYTSPRYAIDVLDDWADKTSVLSKHRRLNLPYSAESKRIRHRRIISWLFFGNTAWTRRIFSLLPADGRMPVPSQDTFLFYCAKRSGERIIYHSMNMEGWDHPSTPRSKRAIAPMVQTDATAAQQKRGVIYYNRGTSCAVRLLVSLHTLRRYYDGPVAILSEGADSHRICNKIGSALNAHVIRWNSGVPDGKNTPFLAKTRLHLGTPFETSVALDSDTIIKGTIDELFQIAESNSFAVAQFSHWKSDGKIIQKRIRSWRTIAADLVEPAVSFGPAVNVGVIAFKRDAQIFEEWFKLALRGREQFIPDEIACQLLLPKYQHKILDSRWNRSCKHDDPDLPDTRVVHYHGKKHCRAGLPFHGDHWMETYQEIIRQNIAKLTDWTPAGDRMLQRYLKAVNTRVNDAQSRPRVYETPLWCKRGHLNKDQADKYAEICAVVKPRYVLETGFCTGRSTACVLYNSPVYHMLSIDVNLDYNPYGRSMATFIHHAYPQWNVIEKSSQEVLSPTFFLSNFPQGIDLVTIDGDHSYDGCWGDLEAVGPNLNPHGVMIVDDYRSGPPNGRNIDSVTQCVDDFLAKYVNEFVGERWNSLGKGFCIIRRRCQ